MSFLHAEQAEAFLSAAAQSTNTVTENRLLAAAQVQALLEVAEAIRQVAKS